MKQEYFLIIGQSARTLSETIDKHLAEGWQLYGDPFSDSDGTETRLCQAVVRTTNAPKKK